ncbi:hypothetical protein [Reichenbachiella sp.]
MNIIELNDYIFYRSYMFYQDGKSYSVGIVSTIQFFTLLTIFAALRSVYDFEIEKYILIGFGIVLLTLNAIRYEGKFNVEELHDKWKKEGEKQKKIKGWVIFLYTAFVVLFPFI